ncbi:MAG: hypothetical protein AB1297_04725, partial [bacterium]
LPTMCMGGTIPFLTRAISRNLVESTRVHARIYAINTAGAFLGTLLAGFYLIPGLGLPLTMAITALGNLGASIFFYLLGMIKGKPQESRLSSNSARIKGLTQLRYPPYILYGIAFLSGFYVMVLENVLIRITNLSLGSSSYSFCMIVAVFILSIACGSFLVERLKTLPRYLLFANQLAITLLLPLVYLSLDTWPYWAHVIRIAFQPNMVGFFAYYSYVFLAMTLVLILPGSLMGATLPIAFHELKEDLKNVGRHSGFLFSYNTIGNLMGSLAGGIVFYYFLNNPGIFLLAIFLSACSTLLSGWHLGRNYYLPALALAILVFFSILYTPFYRIENFMLGTFREMRRLPYSLSGPSNFFKRFHQGRALRFYEDGPSCTVSVIETLELSTKSKKSLAIIVNGKSDSSTTGDIYTLKLSAHLPALLSEKRKKVMVIGLGTGVTAGEMSLYPDIERIDLAEISPTVVKALPYFYQSTYNVHKNPRVKIHIGDAFRILGRSQEKWDIVISEPSNPWVTGVDLLFTKEFYRLVKQHLTEKGILLQWVQIYSASPSMVGMMINTLQQEFKCSHVFIANSGDLLILASNKPFSLKDIERAGETLNQNKKVKASLEEINFNSIDEILIREIWTSSYIFDYFSGFPLQTMDRPSLHYIAGKSFFQEEFVPDGLLLNQNTSSYFPEYLIAMRYKNWQDFPFSQEKFNSLLLSVRDKVSGSVLPVASALRLKAHLSNPAKYPLFSPEREKMGVGLIPFIRQMPEKEGEWSKIGLEGASFRKKAGVLIARLKYRNWVVPYPIDGLKSLLEQGIKRGKDVYEKNWCSLQLALLLLSERVEKERVEVLLEKAIKGSNGKPILKKEDEVLWQRVNKLLYFRGKL